MGERELAELRAALKNPSAITSMFTVNGDGTYTVRFYNGTQTAYVTVDSMLPTDARRVSVGDTAVIELADGETRTATVHSITPALDAQSKTATLVLMPQGAAQLTAGQGVRVRVRPGGQPSDGRMTLPEESVQTVEGKNMVFVRGPKGFQATEVVIGERSGGRIEIISGIPAGAVIATKGAFLLKAELGKGEAEH
mgnify:CR=1 FL=1